jgi:hypothetical protein
MPGTDIGTQRVLNGMLSLELDQRVEAFDATIAAVKNRIADLQRPGVFIVPDTSFYIEHSDKLQDADFRPVLQIWHEPVNVLVPIAVIDELDNLKKSKDKHITWRASHTLAVLDRVVGTPPGPGLLRPEDFSMLGAGGLPSGEVTIEILFYPPGHVRLPITDDEIVSRILAIEPLAGRPVTLLTYDTGQATRGRAADLQVRKLDKPKPSPESSAGG